ncbi:RtcB family protein [Thermomonospora cellulosilytica]|uniref:tRNA-splicing ligase RtcB n=1 Tax=Thermomonospora cellulosilytica TaxID=1411118 RepID=A0A7W3MYC9_9ACTN|nr:RtcB family protein [Thermomonospora cellulosilytica]MBA9004121.1 tRNA-splicing ligase RtcB [Thermomonospora cellulosilytica]
MTVHLAAEGPYRFRIEPTGAMRVPGVVFASHELLHGADKAIEQVANVAMLPGVVDASYAMPDVHWGYGFAIGGVAATDPREGGVVSPGGVGFDISCGVRLLAADIDAAELRPVLERVMDGLDPAVPRGMGKGAVWHLPGRGELTGILTGGSRYAVEHGHGDERDLLRCEDAGAVADADPGQVGERAVQRGAQQVGSLGSGNHFLEVQRVAEVYDPAAAEAFGLRPDQVCVMIHCGSRGLGHQICTDHVRAMEKQMARHGITVPDRQLACAPVDSAEGRAYLGAMAAAANYGRANRQLLAQAARQVFRRAAGARLDLVYDVSHNLAKLEDHEVGGERRRLCVHRKGATRALPPGHPDLPPDLREVGQPVLIPGTMGTSSYVLVGVPGGRAFHSTCHGAGRVQSRHQAARGVSGRHLRDTMEAHGIAVRASSWRGLAEETPDAYKDVSAVVEASEGAGLCRKVARLTPIGVVKG